MKTRFLVLAILFNISLFAQFSKTHYIPPVSSEIITAGQQSIYISTSSTNPVNFNISQLGGTTISGTVSRDNPYIHNIGTGNDTQMHVTSNNVHTPLKNKGYVIEAQDLVAVSVRIASNDRNHASSIVSKGIAALGKEFRIGAFLNNSVTNYSAIHYTFASILATENNTTIKFSDIKPNSKLINNLEGNTPSDIVLNSGESFVLAVEGGTNNIPDALIGALISADKPIAVNCGSFGGSNGDSNNLDMGFDQIVSAETIANISPETTSTVPSTPKDTEYIFIKSDGWDLAERVLLIAHKDNTEIFLNDESTSSYTLNKGEYAAIDGSRFSTNGNLYVRTSKNVFAYQSVGSLQRFNNNGSKNFANQELFFVPPLSCQTPTNINNIPFIEKIGEDTFVGRITLVTKAGATLSFIKDGIDYSLATLPNNGIDGPKSVTGNPDYVTYTIFGLTGNISVFSTAELYIAAYGNSGAATLGGYYSGFTFKPEVVFSKANTSSTGNCTPNINLSVSTSSSFDTFQWYFNDNPISGATTNSYTPTQSGFYKVRASISSSCPFLPALTSDNIPVSACPTDTDNDLANDNIDIDWDNDGILNCTESFGNQNINTSVSNGTIPQSSTTYNANYTAIGLSATTPFQGNTDGSFTTEIPAGKQNQVVYDVNFNGTPTNFGIDYPTSIAPTDLFNSNSEYVISCETNKTLTILNPNNQLLIDTNYDGVYETGITQFSSFEIRFRLNGSMPLAAGSGLFKILGNGITTVKIKHKNLSDSFTVKSTLRIYALCVPRDSDGDTIPDQLDTDSDNDAILDNIEAQGTTAVSASNNDSNQDGLDNAFEPGFIPQDTDGDGIADYLDLDSDNDGILDNIETANDSDADTIKNYRDLDADADGCFDVKEAGFEDANNDGILGNTTPPTVSTTGLVVGAANGYTTPHQNYLTAAPITITTQPTTGIGCLLDNASLNIASNAEMFQWQLSTDNGINWTNLTNNAAYTGVTTATLTINSLANTMATHLFRVQLNRNGNSCDFFSTSAGLTIHQLPTLLPNKRLEQCTENTAGYSIFNLDEIRNQISTNYLAEKFKYFHTEAAALANQSVDEIKDFEKYSNQVPFTETIWARVTNDNNCTSVISFNIYVSTAGTLFTLPEPRIAHCDDYVDAAQDDYDGIATFDLTINFDFITNFFNNPDIEIKFYKNEDDYYQENNNGQSLAITDLANYRNIGYKNYQKIWVRVENKITNACLGKPVTFELIVEPKPNIDLNTNGAANTHICTDDPSVYQTLTSGLPTTENPNDYSYEWTKDGQLLPFTTETIDVNEAGNYTVKVAYKAGEKCYRERSIKVSVSNSAQLVGTPIIKDLIENSSITVTVSGDGNYVYTLDDPYATTQPTGYFENIAPGVHAVYVIDLNGCSVLKVPFSIVGFPKFFTPNGDGYNDHWNIIGANASFNADAKVLVFDRFGKLLKELNPLTPGWDGTFLGRQLPADDYWYTAQLKDGRSIKGHFTLKR